MSQEQIWAILTPLLTTAAVSGVTYIGYTIAKLINIYIARIQHEQLDSRIYKIVRAAEQMGGTSEAKLNYATEQATLFAQGLGLTLSRAEIRTLVEAAVHAMTVEETAATITTVTLPAATSTTTTEATVTSTTSPDGVAAVGLPV